MISLHQNMKNYVLKKKEIFEKCKELYNQNNNIPLFDNIKDEDARKECEKAYCDAMKKTPFNVIECEELIRLASTKI